MTDVVQVLCTNDFGGAWNPAPASTGQIPGGRGLLATIERLRGQAPSVWVDAGDLAIEGVLAVSDQGETAWRAAESLGIDLAVPGNHEFDMGVDRFRELVRDTSMTYICANADLGLSPTEMIDSPIGPIGFIGLTYPDLVEISPDLAVLDQPPLGETVRKHARELRADGAPVVIAVIHDGVDGPGGPDRDRFLGEWYREVDAVIAGHTLWPYIDTHKGVPVCQPAPGGVEVGVLELHRDGTIRCYGVPVDSDGPWDGIGSAVLDEARAETLATCGRPLYSALGRPNELLDALAQTMERLCAADAAIVSLWDCFVSQPVSDGVLTYLPAGPFTRAELMRYSPHADEPIHLVEIDRDQFERAQELSEIPFLATLGVAESSPRPAGTLRVAASQRQVALYADSFGVESVPVMNDGRATTLADVWLGMLAETNRVS